MYAEDGSARTVDETDIVTKKINVMEFCSLKDNLKTEFLDQNYLLDHNTLSNKPGTRI